MSPNLLEHYDPEFETRQAAMRKAKQDIQDFAVDQATDPLNYVGLGVGKLGSMLGKAAVGTWGALRADDADAFVLGRIPKGSKELYEKTLKESLDSGISSEIAEKVAFNESGVYKGSDGKFRYYIPDYAAKLNQKVYDQLGKNGPVDIMSVLEHSGLFKAAPHLKDVRVAALDDAIRQKYNLSKDTHGLWDSSSQTMFVDNQSLLPTVNQTKGNFDPTRPISGGALDVLLHELQHVEQGRSKLPRGGSPEMFLPKDFEKQKQAANLGRIEAAKNFVNSANLSDQAITLLLNEANNITDLAARSNLTRLSVPSYTRFVNEGRKFGLDSGTSAKFLNEFFKKSMEMKNLANMERQAISKYRRLYGESEARMTQENIGRNMQMEGVLPSTYQTESLQADPFLMGETDYIFR